MRRRKRVRDWVSVEVIIQLWNEESAYTTAKNSQTYRLPHEGLLCGWIKATQRADGIIVLNLLTGKIRSGRCTGCSQLEARSGKHGIYEGVKDGGCVGEVVEEVSRVVLGTNTGAWTA